MDQTANGVESSLVSRGQTNYFQTKEFFRIQIPRPHPGSYTPTSLGMGLMDLHFSKVLQVIGGPVSLGK